METRESLRAKGWDNEEQITDYLNTMSAKEAELKKANEALAKKDAELKNATETVKTTTAQLEEANKANMSNEELIAKKMKEADERLEESSKTLSRVKVKEILVGEDVSDELIETMVNADLDKSVNAANIYKSHLTTLKENVEKKTKEGIANLNVEPPLTNKEQTVDDEPMTITKFKGMGASQQAIWKKENPEEYQELNPLNK